MHTNTHTVTRPSPFIRSVMAFAVSATLLTVASLPSTAAAAADTGPTRRTTVPDAGLSVEYPESWTRLPLDPRAFRRFVRKVAAHNPRLRRTLDQEAQRIASEAVRFAAVDPASGSTFLVLAIDLPTPGPDDALDIARSFEAQGTSVLGMRMETVAGTPAARVDLSRELQAPSGEPVAMRAAQLYVPNGDGTTIIQVATTDGPEAAALIDRLVQGIRRADR